MASERMDVRRMLLRRGWSEAATGYIRKNAATWAVVNDAGGSFLSGPSRRGGEYTAEFPADAPARVIVAACEAAAGVRLAAQSRLHDTVDCLRDAPDDAHSTAAASTPSTPDAEASEGTGEVQEARE